jgi:hypothetical protein
VSSRNLSRRLERIEAELAPPKDQEMVEICFSDLVTGEIIQRMFLPAEAPKRCRMRLWSQNASARSSSVRRDAADDHQ